MAYQYQPYQPGLYQPYQYQPIPPMQNPQPLNQPIQGPVQAVPGPADERIWVSGEGAANAYLVAANGFVRLWDSTSQVFYEKSADATGKPLPLVVYEYKRRGGDPAPDDYTEQIDALKRRLDDLEERLATKKPTRKESKDDE